jgi:hypothetical protein
MDRAGFRAYLAERQATAEATKSALAVAERFESCVRKTHGVRVDQASADAAKAFASELIESGDNTYDNYLALARFGRFVRNHAVLVAMLEILDGHEALGNLYDKVGDELDDTARDRVFAGIDVPPLGVSNLQRARLMRQAVERLEAAVGHERCARLIGRGLRDLPDEGYAEERRRFEQAGGIDEYLRRKGDRFVAELEGIRDQGALYFSQPITDEVIAYVEAHPEIRQGVRVGNVLYEAKIPYMAREYLAETDPKLRAYYYCHCPWARESLRQDEAKVSTTFCNCSAAFHKKPYEVIFGRKLEAEVLETVLAGDPWCRFAVHLPEDVA